MGKTKTSTTPTKIISPFQEYQNIPSNFDLNDYNGKYPRGIVYKLLTSAEDSI
jgi:hypothetical protein